MDWFSGWVLIFSFSCGVSLFCIANLFYKQSTWWNKVFWIIIILIPFLGPIVYGSFYGGPPEQWPDDLRSTGTTISGISSFRKNK